MKKAVPLGRVGIVGSGGGFRGVAIVGFLEVLLKKLTEGNIPVVYLAGVSVSALNLCRLSEAKKQGDLLFLLDDLIAIWNYVEKNGPKSVFNIKWRKVLNNSSLLPSEPLFRLLRDFDPSKSILSPITFDCFVFDDENQEHKTLSNRDPLFINNPGLFKKAVAASASLSPYFPTIQIDNRSYSDGGYIDLSRAMTLGCNTIFVLFPYPKVYIAPNLAIIAFIEKHFPWMLTLIRAVAALLRERDSDSLRSVYERNWREVLKLRIPDQAVVLKTIEENPEEAFYFFGDLSERVKTEIADNFQKHGRKIGWFERQLSRSWQEIVLGLIRIVPLYAEPSQTLSVNNFNQGDFGLVRQRARQTATAEWEKLASE